MLTLSLSSLSYLSHHFGSSSSFTSIPIMIHPMLLPTHSETSTTSSSSHLYPWPEPGTLQLPTQQQEHDHEEKHSAKQDGQSDSFPTNLLKPITPQTELDYCSRAKAQGTMIKLEPTTIFLNPSKACVDCNTTKTPLWRSGPQGPKSLCNACGIRHRKARRALAAIAAGDDPSKLQPNLKRTKLQQHLDPTLTSKKRSKIQQKGSHSHQLCIRMENLHVGCSDHDGKEGLYYARRVFPKDEEEAAVLLMALSCGLVHG